MLDADAVINNSSRKVDGSYAYLDPAPKKWVGPDPEKHIGSTPLYTRNGLATRLQAESEQQYEQSVELHYVFFIVVKFELFELYYWLELY